VFDAYTMVNKPQQINYTKYNRVYIILNELYCRISRLVGLAFNVMVLLLAGTPTIGDRDFHEAKYVLNVRLKIMSLDR